MYLSKQHKLQLMSYMKQIIVTIVLFLSVFANSQIPNVNYEYDNDGNMKLRKTISIGPSNAKNNQENEIQLEDNIGQKKIVIYPNPTEGIFQVAVKELNPKEKNSYCIYSLNGTLLLKGKLHSETTSIDIQGFNEGTFLLDVYLGELISRWKIIKK